MDEGTKRGAICMDNGLDPWDIRLRTHGRGLMTETPDPRTLHPRSTGKSPCASRKSTESSVSTRCVAKRCDVHNPSYPVRIRSAGLEPPNQSNRRSASSFLACGFASHAGPCCFALCFCGIFRSSNHGTPQTRMGSQTHRSSWRKGLHPQIAVVSSRRWISRDFFL